MLCPCAFEGDEELTSLGGYPHFLHSGGLIEVDLKLLAVCAKIISTTAPRSRKVKPLW